MGEGSCQPKLILRSLHLMCTSSAGLHSSVFTCEVSGEMFSLHLIILPIICLHTIIFSLLKNPVRALECNNGREIISMSQ